jgi:aerobic-type carbon monoxide dehydrogenase small subunit (CoxS/CutS family)
VQVSGPGKASPPPVAEPSAWRHIELEVNGDPIEAQVESRLLLSDLLRHRLGLTGTHVGCEQGSCGACTVLVDGRPVRSCLMLAVQATGASVTTVEGLAGSEDELGPVQQAFHDEHAMQCGFCTPGLLMTITALVEAGGVDEDELADHLCGHLCRCTGYGPIRTAARIARRPGVRPDR